MIHVPEMNLHEVVYLGLNEDIAPKPPKITLQRKFANKNINLHTDPFLHLQGKNNEIAHADSLSWVITSNTAFGAISNGFLRYLRYCQTIVITQNIPGQFMANDEI